MLGEKTGVIASRAIVIYIRNCAAAMAAIPPVVMRERSGMLVRLGVRRPNVPGGNIK
jgi:hypothetical protein